MTGKEFVGYCRILAHRAHALGYTVPAYRSTTGPNRVRRIGDLKVVYVHNEPDTPTADILDALWRGTLRALSITESDPMGASFRLDTERVR